jgi:hypothetical protein
MLRTGNLSLDNITRGIGKDYNTLHVGEQGIYTTINVIFEQIYKLT